MGSIEKLTEQQVDAQLKKLKEWTLAGEAIQRTYLFADFVTAIRFVDQVAQLAETAQHHPDMLIRYRKVTLTLATHDAGGITVKDFDLALKCDTLSARFAPPPPPAPTPSAPPAAPSGSSKPAPSARAAKKAAK